MVTFDFLSWQPPPPHHHGLWRFTLAPGKMVPPICFHQNDHEGCRIYHPDDLGHFLFGLGATCNPLPHH